MTEPSETTASEPSEAARPSDAPDLELLALPAPRRRARRATLVTMTLTTVASLFMIHSLRSDFVYAMGTGSPSDVGGFSELVPGPAVANRWVRGDGEMSYEGAIRYGRPLDGDTWRLAPLAGNDRIWVEVRVPAGHEGPRFVPPTSFVGRLVSLSEAGIRHSSLRGSVQALGGKAMPPDAWLLVDGEAPATTRWALGLVALLVGFVAFNVYGLVRLLLPVRDGDG